MDKIYKYPKTYHLESSGLSAQKKTKQKAPFAKVYKRNLVIEEKVDGANVAISFSQNGELLLQSRGHFLTGGVRERHFSLFKQWTSNLITELYLVLGDRYILYGEWLYAKHSIFYNALPHYFLEYDLLDTQTGEFLDTPSRRRILQDLPIASVPVLHSGKVTKYSDLTRLVGQSNYIQSGHLTSLKSFCQKQNLDLTKTLQETDNTNLMEGLYIKVEESGVVRERYKFIREDFILNILNSGGHWLDRDIIPNLIKSS